MTTVTTEKSIIHKNSIKSCCQEHRSSLPSSLIPAHVRAMLAKPRSRSLEPTVSALPVPAVPKELVEISSEDPGEMLLTKVTKDTKYGTSSGHQVAVGVPVYPRSISLAGERQRGRSRLRLRAAAVPAAAGDGAQRQECLAGGTALGRGG